MSSDLNYPCLWAGPGTIRGPALILNYEFENGDENQRRIGSNYDVEALEKNLANLGYNVKVENDSTHQGTFWALGDFDREATIGAATTDSVIVVVLSHGIAGDEWTGSKFFTDDNREIGTQAIVDRIHSISSLRDKPKIFFFNICRQKGGEVTGGKDGEIIENKHNTMKATVTLHEDTLIVYSTLPRFASYRKEESGSVFIQLLCKKLSDRAQVAQKDLVSLIDEVVNDMEKDKETPPTEKQIPEIVKRKFTKKFYFVPLHKLRKHYLDHECKIVPLPWYRDQDWSVDEIYTELVIEEREETFPLEEVFKHAKERFRNGGSYRIIIEGNPGYGKSTLMLKMASDWSKQSTGKDYMNQFRYVFLVRLGRLGGHDTIENYLMKTYQDLLEIDVKPVLQGSENQQVLIILDGFDEANQTTKKMVHEIMESQTWSQCHVILTSRFGYVANFIKTKALCIVVKGFSDKQVAVAVGKHFIKAGHLTKTEVFENSPVETTLDDFCHVEERPQLETERIKPIQFGEFARKVISDSPYKELARCPLLCAMMCCLVEDCPDGVIPDTLTELYFAIINRNLYRAQAKLAQNFRENVEEWNWAELQNEFQEEHEEYLLGFGPLCLSYIQTKSPGFTVFDIVGKKHGVRLDNPKVIRLIEAGVMIKAFESKKESIFHPTHRSMAEFLAAYYLTLESDTEKVSTGLFQLYSEDSSFYEICNFCAEMGRGETVAKAFQDIKLARGFVLTLNERNGRFHSLEKLENLLRQMSHALPIDIFLPYPGGAFDIYIKKIFDHLGSAWRPETSCCVRRYEQKLTNRLKMVTSRMQGSRSDEEFVASLVRLLEESFSLECHDRNREIKIRETSQNCRPSLLVRGVCSECNAADMMFLLLRGVMQSRIRLSSLTYESYINEIYRGYGIKEDTDSVVTDGSISCDLDTINVKLARRLQLLLKSDVCPEAINFQNDCELGEGFLKLLKDAPSNCLLTELDLNFRFDKVRDDLYVLLEDWLPNRLVKLNLRVTTRGDQMDGIEALLMEPLIRGVSSSDRLTSLTLCNIDYWGYQDYPIIAPEGFIEAILQSKLQELELANMRFTVTRDDLAKWTLIPGCKLERVRLRAVSLQVEDPDDVSWKHISIPLKELSLIDCCSLEEMLIRHGSPFQNLRALTVTINKEESLREALEVVCKSNRSSLTKLTIEKTSAVIIEESLPQILLHCPSLETLRLEDEETDGEYGLEMLRFSSHLVPRKNHEQDSEKMPRVCQAALKLPCLRRLDFSGLRPNYSNVKAFCVAIADIAQKAEKYTLTLSGFKCDWAALATLIFRERKLNFSIKYVDETTYEIDFLSKDAPEEPKSRCPLM